MLASLVMLLFGVILVWKSGTVLTTFSYILGGFFLAIAIISFINYFKEQTKESVLGLDIAYAIICTLAGLFLIVKPTAFASIVPLILGIWMAISSAVKVQYAFQLRLYRPSAWVGTLVMALLGLLCGIILVFYPFQGAVALTKMIGIFLIIYAVIDIISTIFVKKELKKFAKTLEIQD